MEPKLFKSWRNSQSARHRRSRRWFSFESLERRDVPTMLPSGFSEAIIATGLSSPTAMDFAPDGRLFVTEQGGDLRVIKNGNLVSTPFVSLNVNSSGERGLLGVAFDPDFATNHFVYVYYTVPNSPIHNRVSRFTANGDVVVPNSEVPILDLPNLSGATNHNGGAIHFGADGKLYVAVGENANPSNSQTLNTRLGKMLRINPNGTIPSDNPFFNTASGANRAIWAMGLRNPFTFAFQPGTGRMFIDDVGQDTREEINDGIAGSNYGWPTCEGDCSPTNANFRDPFFHYDHGNTDTTGCAIAGGAFYNPATGQFPADYTGDYFFADLCNHWIRRFDPSDSSVTDFATGLPGFTVDLKVDSAGSLYYLDRDTPDGGIVGQIQFAAMQPPAITQQPADLLVVEGQSAMFHVSSSGTPPLSYQWQRNDADIPGATSSNFTLSPAMLSDDGAMFRVIVTNSFGTANSDEATLSVTMNQAPTGTIISPLVGTKYNAGNTIFYSGTGTDPEDGTLPASAFTWQVVLHHADHEHPFVPARTGSRSGSFTIPTMGETSTDVFYHITLTVMDSLGLTHTSFRDVSPNISTLTLATNPDGLQLTLDGQPVTAPSSVDSVVGMSRSLGVVSPQTLVGTAYQFASWSDRRAATHAISTPASNTTFTASFREIPKVAFDLANSSGSEATRSVRLAVSLSAPTDRTVAVAFAVSGGTATGGGVDYSLSSGRLKFRRGQTTKLIGLRIVNDRSVEGDETIIVTLSNPVNSVLGSNTNHTYTILDNDPAPILQSRLSDSSRIAAWNRENRGTTTDYADDADRHFLIRVHPRNLWFQISW